MMFVQEYGTTEGPLGFPMIDKQARALDLLLKTLPRGKEYEYRKAVLARAPTELNPGERSDVSWISTESVDRANEVVSARGMNDAQFAQNPLVTLGHSYALPPVGKSLWRKRVKDGGLTGIKAKTLYPARPKDWPAAEPWNPDQVFGLVQAGLMNGKSIGFLPTRVHVPDEKERQHHGWNSVELVIDEWLLLEYACVFLPCNQDALVEEVSKGRIDAELIERLARVFPELRAVKGVVPFEETPTAPEDHPWDAAAARQRLKEWAGGAPWEPHRYRRAFAYVAGTGQHLDDYKLPHHDILNGRLVVVWHGVHAALAALSGARASMGLSEEDEKAVRAHLEKHYRQFGKEPPAKSHAIANPNPLLVFTPLEEIEKAIARRVEAIDFAAMAQQAVDRVRGRV